MLSKSKLFSTASVKLGHRSRIQKSIWHVRCPRYSDSVTAAARVIIVRTLRLTRQMRSDSQSITSSARNSIDWGMFKSSTFAVLRLITASNLVGCKTGMSAGLAPLTIWPA